MKKHLSVPRTTPINNDKINERLWLKLVYYFMGYGPMVEWSLFVLFVCFVQLAERSMFF